MSPCGAHQRCQQLERIKKLMRTGKYTLRQKSLLSLTRVIIAQAAPMMKQPVSARRKGITLPSHSRFSFLLLLSPVSSPTLPSPALAGAGACEILPLLAWLTNPSRKKIIGFRGFHFCWSSKLSCPVEEPDECWDWLRTGERGWRWEQTSFLGAGELI